MMIVSVQEINRFTREINGCIAGNSEFEDKCGNINIPFISGMTS